MTKLKKSQLLIVLGVFWVIILLVQFSDDSEHTVASSNQVGSVALPTPSSSVSQSSLTLADVLKHPRQKVAFSKPRNIFAPLNSKKPVLRHVSKAPPPKPSSRPSAIARRPPAPPPGPSPGELAAQRARQQLNQYRFLGYLKKGGESQAFLTNGQAIYIVKQGETLEGRIHIHKIDPTTIVLSTKVRETGDNVEATIPLTKEQQG